MATTRLHISSPGSDQRSVNTPNFFVRSRRTLRAVARAATFFLKVFPMLPSQPVDWVTKTPVVEKVKYPTCSGMAEGELYRPPTDGPHPGILVCLGVVPFEVDHPQVPVLGKALARAGFAALLYWSPAMRDFRLDPEDLENIPLAYNWLIEQPFIDPARSGLLGTCVGGSFALMAAAHPLVRDRVGFVSAYAPFSSMWTFARDIASATIHSGDGQQIWKVDPLTQKVFVHSVTDVLEPDEAELLRNAFADGSRRPVDCELSDEGQAVFSLLNALDAEEADSALQCLPAEMQERLSLMSPVNYQKNLHSPLVLLLHDQGDQVIPVGESRRLFAALGEHSGVQYTEMGFQHLDPVKGKLPLSHLMREFAKFLRAIYPIFWQAEASSSSKTTMSF